MYPRLTYFLGGAVAAGGMIGGVIVTVTDPNIMENVITFPDRIEVLFEDEKPQVIDDAAIKIILEGRLRKMFEYNLDIPDRYKDQLAAHFAGECLKEPDKILSIDDRLESPMATSAPKITDHSRNNFGITAENIAASVSNLPGLMTGCYYRVGITLGVMGELPKRDHVENPTQTPLKDGAIRLTAGGGLFALPIVYEAMQSAIGSGSGPADITVDKVGDTFNLN